MGGTRTMAQGFNSNHGRCAPIRWRFLSSSEARGRVPHFTLSPFAEFIRALLLVSLSLLEAQPPAALYLAPPYSEPNLCMSMISG
jgi:hypothetical protein